MGLNITELRDSMKRICGIDLDDAGGDYTLIDNLLNRSWWEVMNKFKFREKDIVSTFPLVIGNPTYDVPDPFEALRSIAVVDNNNQHKTLDRVTSKWYEDQYDSDPDKNDIPAYYFRENTTITVFPTPDDTYNIFLRYSTTLADLSAINSVIVIPQEWHEIILYGGVWRMMIELGDWNRCNEVKKHQIALIDSCIPVEAKEAGDSRHANLEVIRADYNLG